MSDKRVERALTHAGKFHADDVFSAALLRLLFPETKIERAFRVPEGFDGLVFDIGLGEFDHHQSGAPVRENGVPYAAFGLLWRAFGERLLPQEEARRFDEKFVQPLDKDDNTGCGDPVAGLIGGFNPTWDSTEPVDGCFFKAVEFAQGILERRLEFSRSIARAGELAREALAGIDDGVVVLSRYAPWKDTLVDSPAVFVVYPSQRGGYSGQAVPREGARGELKCPFPLEWRGKRQEELSALTGLGGLNFCHNSGFLIAADSLEEAIAACRLAQRQAPEEAPETAKPAPLRPGRYRHFKGGEYEVLGVAEDSETLEKKVVYRALYGEGGLWVRPLAMFLEQVERDGVRQPRFTFCGE